MMMTFLYVVVVPVVTGWAIGGAIVAVVSIVLAV
jgi:hypothetical protein